MERMSTGMEMMRFGYEVGLGVGYRALGVGYMVLGVGYMVLGVGYMVLGVGYRVVEAEYGTPPGAGFGTPLVAGYLVLGAVKVWSSWNVEVVYHHLCMRGMEVLLAGSHVVQYGGHTSPSWS